MRIVCAMLLIVAVQATPLIAAAPDNGKVTVRSFSRFADLPHSDVNDITQDCMGYMWFATYGGLCRWDGYRLKVFNSENSSLNRERVMHICATQDSLLYVGTESGGLNALDLRTMSFLDVQYDYSFQEDVPFSFSIGADGTCYYSHSNRLSKLERRDDEVHVTTVLKTGEAIESILVAPEGLYLGTSDGLFLYADGHVTASLPSLCWVKGLALSSDGSLVAASPEGVFRISRGLSSCARILSTPARSIVAGSGDAVWVGTNNDGLYMIDGSTASVTRHFAYSPFKRDQITSSEISAIHEDRTGVLWIGTIGGGLDMLNMRNSNIRCYTSEEGLSMDRVMAFCDLGHDLIISTRGAGLDMMSADGRFRHLTINGADSRTFPIISSFCKGPDGSLLLGTWEHGAWKAMSIHGNDLHAERYGDDEQLANISINAIQADPAGKIWICTANGLYRFNAVENTAVPIGEHLSSDFILNVCFQGSGDDMMAWVATRQGLDCVKVAADSMVSVTSVSSDHFFSDLIVDNAGRLWATTLGDGAFYVEDGKLCRLKSVSGRFISNELESVEEDRNGVLWFGGYGLTSYDPNTGVLRNFTQKDGLQSNSFKVGASYVRDNGDLVFGGTEGFNIIDPANIKVSQDEPVPSITSVWCGDEDLDIRNCMKLKYNQNSLRFEFSSMVYNDNTTDRFRYKLEGYESDWHESDWHSPEATYLHLPAGYYRFIVQSANSAGEWGSVPASVDVTIRPHPLRSPFAIAAYVMICIALLMTALQMAFRRQKEKDRQKAEQEKLRLFTDMAHEIKTPLSLIVAPVDELLDSPAIGASTRNKLQVVHRNVDSLRSIVEQLLDLRKYEDKLMKLSVAEVDICRILNETSTLFTSYAGSKGIMLKTELGDRPQMVFLDKSKIERVVVNLISNAIKFTPAGGCIVVRCSSDSRTVTFSVEDNGVGIKHKDRKRIFERFYQSDNQTSSSSGGTGIGLALSKNIVEQHGGQIWVESDHGFGSKFFVRLLKGRAQFTDDQIDTSYASSDSLSNYDTVEHSCAKDSRKEAVVLVADDNDDLRTYIADALSDRYDVITAKDGKDAWDKVLACKPDLVLSDVVMPEVNGIELCNRIKHDPETMHILVVLLTARDLSSTELDSLKVGADAFMTKPFRINVLNTRIRNLISSRDNIRKIYGSTIEAAPSEVRVESSDEKFVRRCSEIVEKHLDDPEFGVEALCEEIGISTAQINRRLNATTGLSPLHFIREMRLKRAAQLLSRDNSSVSEVAYQVGFNNLSYFTKLFKARFGCLPKDFTSDDIAKI